MKLLYDARIADVLTTAGAAVVATCLGCQRSAHVPRTALAALRHMTASPTWSGGYGASVATAATALGEVARCSKRLRKTVTEEGMRVQSCLVVWPV